MTAGAVALMLQKRPTLKPDQVKALVVNTGTLLTKGVVYGKNIRELNLAKALTASTPSTTQIWFASNGTVGTCCAPYREVGLSLCDPARAVGHRRCACRD